MDVILTLLLLVAMAATLFMLVRGIFAFLRADRGMQGSDAANPDQFLPSQSSIRQNKAMMGRIAFQALSIIIVVILLILYGGR